MTLERLKNVRNRWHNTDWNRDTASTIYASNDGCAGHLAAPLYSLMDHSRSTRNMDTYVLSVGICRKYREQLSGIADRFHKGLYVVELGDLRNKSDFDIGTRGLDISAMARLFVPQVLSEIVARALYLDCDTIMYQSIRPLYETDLGDYLAGTVMRPTAYEEMKASIDLQKGDLYHNSGVLLMDLGGWRRENVSRRLLGSYRSRQGRLFACGQDTVNGALKGRIETLPVKYNYFTNHGYFRYATLCFPCGTYREAGEEAYREAGKAPAVIHYLGDERPQTAGNHNHFRKLYEYYLAKIPWKDIPKQRGKERYMHMQWIFNHLTWICLSFRL